MNQEHRRRDQSDAVGYLSGSMSRKQLLKVAAAGAALAATGTGATVAHADLGSLEPGSVQRLEFPFFPQVTGTYTPEDIRDIFNMLLTMERFGVAINTANLSGAIDPNINPIQVSIQRASLVTNIAHVDWLESIGARSLTDTFTVGPPATFSAGSLKRTEVIITIYLGAYIAAAREFAEMGQPLLVKWAVQVGGIYAENRAYARALMAVQNVPDTNPPNNKAFETDLFLYVRDAYALLTKLGLFGGLPRRLDYPSRDAALALAGSIGAKVIQKVPNNATTSITSPADVTKERL